MFYPKGGDDLTRCRGFYDLHYALQLPFDFPLDFPFDPPRSPELVHHGT